MQDLQTGGMRELPEGFKDLLPDQQRTMKDIAIPKRENQGPVFEVGEVLEIRGGKFRVHAITSKRIYLDSIPSK